MRKMVVILFIFSIFLMGEEIEIKEMKGKIVELKDGEIFIESGGAIESYKIAPLWFLIENDYKIELGEEAEISFFIIKEEKTIQQIKQKKSIIMFADKKGNAFWERKGIFRKKPEQRRSVEQKNRRELRRKDNTKRR